MRVSYDPEINAAYIRLTDEPVAPAVDSVPCDGPGGVSNVWVVLDWKDGCLVGIEVLDADVRLPADLLASAERPGASD